MTRKQIQAVQQSWKLVSELEPLTVGSLFYHTLFTLDPALRPLFRSPIPEQSRKLLMMIGVVVRELHQLDDLLDDVRRLSERHVGYGVQPGHYDTVGQALLITLEQGLGGAWTPELRDSWAVAYDLLSSAMIEAAAGAAVA